VKALKRLSWLEKVFLLAALLLALVALSLAFLWNRAQAEEKEVEAAIAGKAAQVERLRLETDLVELNRRLEEVRARLAEAPFPEVGSRSRLEELILTTGGMTLHEVALGEEGIEKVGTREYRTIISYIRHRGPLPSLLSYMKGLVSGPFTTLYLDNLSLRQVEGDWEADFDIVLLLRGAQP